MMKKNKIKKLIFLLVFLATLSPKPTYAYVAWPDIIGNSFGTMLKEMMETIQEAIVGALQQAAYQTINQTINNAIGGGVNGPLFIQDWTDYLVNQPLADTQIYMNNLLTEVYQGRGSALNYSYPMDTTYEAPPASNYSVQAVGGTSQSVDSRVATLLQNEGIGGNYFSSAVESIKSNINQTQIPTPTIQNYVPNGNVRNLFAQSNWKATSALFDNPMNTEIGAKATFFDPVQQNMFEQAQKIAQTQGNAYGGYLPVIKNGLVITPGTTIADIQANVEDLGNKILANAQSIPQVITAMVTRLVTKTITQGIGNVQSKVQKEINTNIRQAKQQINTNLPQDSLKLNY